MLGDIPCDRLGESMKYSWLLHSLETTDKHWPDSSYIGQHIQVETNSKVPHLAY